MKHLHHIVPRHMGGTDNPDNLVELTVEEHAEAHRKLYEEFGKQEDYIAWKGLTGHMGKEEIIKELLSLAGKKGSSSCRDSQKGTCFNPELLKTNQLKGAKARGLKNKGAIWWHNGEDYKFCIDQPEGYYKSSAPNNVGSKTSGTFWWNNGVINKRAKTRPDEGWTKGRI